MKNEWLVLDEQLMNQWNEQLIADNELSYVIVPITNPAGKWLDGAKGVMQSLRDHQIPFGVTTYFAVSSLDEVGDQARLLYRHLESLGVDQSQWLFIEVENETVSRMREAVSHFCRVLRECGMKYLGLRAKKRGMTHFMLDDDVFDVIDAIEYEVNEDKLDRHAFHHPELHEFTNRGHLNGYPGEVIMGHCEGHFTMDELISTDHHCHRWFYDQPFEVKVKNTIPFYCDEACTQKEGQYPTGEVLHLINIIHDDKRSVFETEDKHYILAEKTNLESLYYEDSHIVGAEVETIRPVKTYKEKEFNVMTELDDHRPGKKFKVEALVHDRYGRPRLEVNHDEYHHHVFITAKKMRFTSSINNK